MSSPLPGPSPADVREPDPQSLLLVVVGAHPQAEIDHRPLAYDLLDRMRRWQAEHGRDDLRPLVVSDLWYLNASTLLARPTVTIGDPDLNAATAFLASRLPTALVVEDTLRIQLDLEHVDLQACLWGVDAAATASCLDLFCDRYLGDFLASAHDLASPSR